MANCKLQIFNLHFAFRQLATVFSSASDAITVLLALAAPPCYHFRPAISAREAFRGYGLP
jgi:hypothetical protein